jgi:hypothetical protein
MALAVYFTHQSVPWVSHFEMTMTFWITLARLARALLPIAVKVLDVLWSAPSTLW